MGADDGELTAAKGNGAGDREFSDDPGTWPGSIGTAGTGGPVISIPGRGGFPLKVTSLGRDQRGQFTALWATLPAVPNPDSVESGTALSAVTEDEPPVVPAVAFRSAPETLECPDFVKAACGLALGLGLTSGPLFPDLITSLPRRLPKWFSVLRSHSRRRVFPRESKRVAPSRIRNWLRAAASHRRENAALCVGRTSKPGPSQPSSDTGGVAGPNCECAVDVARGPQCQSAPAADVFAAMAQALKIGPDDSQLDRGVRVGPGGGLFEVRQRHVPAAQPQVGAGATQVGFGELGIASECKRPFPHGLFDLAERDQCGRFVQVDSVDCARIDCGVEEVESRFVVAGGGSQDSLELEQPRLIKLNGKATVDVVLGSAIIPAEKANPCTNQVSLRRVGRNLKSPRGSSVGRIFLV